jgi:hypothetical protein
MGERRSNITGGAREDMHVSGDIRYTCGNDMVTAVDCLHIGQPGEISRGCGSDTRGVLSGGSWIICRLPCHPHLASHGNLTSCRAPAPNEW